MKTTTSNIDKRNVIKSIIAAELILLIPLIAMAFSDEADWGAFDFIVIGILLAGAGISCQLIAHGIKNGSRLAAAGVILATLIILTWIELAVGIFNTPFAGS